MSHKPSDFKYVSYLWEEDKANQFSGSEVDLFIYRSNLLGTDLRLTNYAGGNTSVKIMESDPVSGEQVEIMWVKGSGGDIGTLTRKGCANLYIKKLHQLKNRYRGLEFEDEMVELFNHCLFDPKCAAPSIDTPLHGLLPFKHIDHLHPDALISIAASKEGEAIMQEIWGDSMIWIPWQRPGFDLGLQLEAAIRNNPSAKGLILGGHGLFSWGATSYESYCNTLTIIEEASVYLNENYGKKRAVFGGTSKESQSKENRLNLVSTYMPEVRGLASSLRRMVGHFSDDERVLEFVNSNDLNRLAAMGTSCPDHFLRTKIRPLVLPANLEEKLAENPAFLEGLFSRYRSEYQLYYDRCKNPDSPAIRDSNPVILLWPGVGMISFAKDKQTARVASEFYLNAINVMKGAEAVSEYQGLPEQEAFDIEYWLLEEAKLQRMPKEKPLSAKVAFITGAGGGIGKAIAKRLAEEGACVVLAELNEDWKTEAETEFLARFGKDKVRSVSLDVMDQNQIQNAFDFACREFGGVDLLVNCAGLAISKSLETTTEADWNLLQDVLVKGQFLCSQKAAEIFRKQGKGGDILNIVSKNALVSGPSNIAYGTAKAAQLHMSRLLAAELGKDKIRVNVVNPDAVIGGSKIWEGAWAEERAKAYNITVQELPAYYASRTLMNEIIYAEDIASAVFAFVGGDLSKCTGNVLNVDGGVAAAFVR